MKTYKKVIRKVDQKVKLKLNEKYIAEIKKGKKVKGAVAYQAMMDAVKKHNISKDTYIKEKFYLLSTAMVDRYFKTNSVKSRVDYISEKYNAPKGLVYKKILDTYAKYKIPMAYFCANNLYEDTSDACLKFHSNEIKKTRQNHIKKMMSITGWDNATVEKYVKDTIKKHGVGLVYILENELFKKTDEEIQETIRENKEEEERRTKSIKEKTGWSDFEFERHRVNCRYRYRIHDIKTYDNLECWRKSNDVLDTYAVPRDAFILSDLYNNVSTEVLDDKTLFDRTFKDFLNRKFWVNRDTSLEEFKEFIEGLDAVFCKPINLNGGHGSYRYDLTGTPEEMYEYFMNEPMMLIEEVIKQHHLINEIYPDCIDSIRIMSVLKDGKFECIGAWMKFGANGSQVDGRIQGGSFAGVDEKTGIIVTTAIDGKNNRFANHPNTGAKILGFQIPYWKEILELTERAMRHIDGIDFVGWDVAITEKGPVIVEGNSKPAFADYQLLFAEDFGGMRKQYAHLIPPDGAPGTRTSANGWGEINGKRYYYKYGIMLKDSWVRADGHTYYMGEDGTMLKDCWLTKDGRSYRMAEDGHVLGDGWYTVEGKNYYFRCSGAVQTGWHTHNGNKYYSGPDGVQRTGWQTIAGKMYYFDKDGVLQIS